MRVQLLDVFRMLKMTVFARRTNLSVHPLIISANITGCLAVAHWVYTLNITDLPNSLFLGLPVHTGKPFSL